MLQAQQRGRQPTPTSQMASGWEPASWSGAGASAVVCWAAQQHPLTSPITWTRRALNRLLGQRSTPSVAAGSAEQLHDAGHQHTHTHSAHDDVTEHERDQS